MGAVGRILSVISCLSLFSVGPLNSSPVLTTLENGKVVRKWIEYVWRDRANRFCGCPQECRVRLEMREMECSLSFFLLYNFQTDILLELYYDYVSRFSTSALTLRGGVVPLPWRVFSSSSPGLHPLDVNSWPFSCDEHKCLQLLPNAPANPNPYPAENDCFIFEECFQITKTG